MSGSPHDSWRQFDFYLGMHPFVWQTFADDFDFEFAEFQGFVLLTQTCDIVRDVSKRPMVELASLVAKTPEEMKFLARGKSPQYLVIQSLIAKNLVADLDYCMTVRKMVLGQCPRSEGWQSDMEFQAMTRALIRKRTRFAFPDEIVDMFRKFENEIEKRHAKTTPLGQFLENLKEIRLQASPNWNASQPSLKMLWVLDLDQDCTQAEGFVQQLMSMIGWAGVLSDLSWELTDLEAMTAKVYLTSEALDFDYLSE